MFFKIMILDLDHSSSQPQIGISFDHNLNKNVINTDVLKPTYVSQCEKYTLA